MIRIIRKRYSKALALASLLSLGSEMFLPTVAYALTSGPSQPEFSSFEPVGTTEMVNEFTGDLTYNLPLLEVPGPHGSSYPLSLSYHSGTSPEEEASWVGYGWTLNAGAINRNTRGLPDDYSGQPIKYHNKMPANWTVSAGGSAVAELFSIDANFFPQGSAGVRYNNYRGFGYSAGVGFSIDGVATLGYNVDNGSGSFSLNINPSGIADKLRKAGKKNEENAGQKSEKNVEERRKAWILEKTKQRTAGRATGLHVSNLELAGSNYGLFTYGAAARPTAISSYTGTSTNFSAGVLATPSFLPIGISGNIFGKFSLQEYQENQDLPAFGYLYSADATGPDAIMDYHVEKETPYQKRDVFLGLPFNDADNFSVSGQEIGGGFRIYHKQIGHFSPNVQESRTVITNLGGEIEAGFNFGGGADGGIGSHTLQVSGWRPDSPLFTDPDGATTDEPVVFRFNNDLGGSWEHATDDQPFQANIKSVPLGYQADIPEAYTLMNEGKRSGRSSFIGYHTNAEIHKAQQGGGGKYLSYTHRADIEESLVQRTDDNINQGIGEIVTFNEAGKRYLYALPVYSRNEKNLQYGLQGVTADKIDQNFSVYDKDDKTKLGEERLAPYASTYLLTEINTPDYIDRTLDGPTDDDFGGYVKFNYQKLYGYKGEISDWFRWRQPYTGLMYHRNSLSDARDDLGSVSSGEKEIVYLKSIQTKTHVAKFITAPREDGLDAASEENALSSRQAKGVKRIRRLERVELYARNRMDKPIKVVYFNYGSAGQELAQGLPNAISGRGKLTLKSVTFEYEQIQESRISYQFGYQYPDFNQYPARYQSLGHPYKQLTADSENPIYSRFDVDAWGNYQMDGASRYAKMQTWMDQSNYDEDPFDPAAWQLKTIKLPSGGEIHVQYEQDDYTYVQDQPAHVMTSIDDVDEGGKFYLNHLDLGIADNDTESLQRLSKMIRQRYVEQGHKIYFKLLYRLLGINTPELSDCNADYITGYTSVRNTGVEGGRVFVQLATGDQYPRTICEDFVRTQRAGNLNLTGNCDASTAGLDKDQGAKKLVNQLLSLAGSLKSPFLCSQINKELSYLRVPTPLSKKGGGIRVKRLLTFDQGLEGQPVLYGNEYDYREIDPETGTLRSSGVATNEPQTIREENILVDFIARKRQGWVSKAIAGKDLEQSEGPLGESVLPAPSVGYRRVAKRNIHSGATNPGFTVSEFYTARDFPAILANETKTPIKEKNVYVPLPLGLINTFINNTWATQGFSIVLNNMHGQPRQMATYGGDYDDIHRLEKATASSSTSYEYFAPGEQVPVMNDLSEGVTYQSLGKEVDITFASKAVEDVLNDGNIEGDGDVGIIPFFIPIPVPFISVAPSLTRAETKLFTHASTKVIRYPTIVKKVTQKQDGILHITEHLAFNPDTGQPTATKSYDDFDIPYIQLTTSASNQYAAMGQKAFSANFRAVSGQDGVTVTKRNNKLVFANNGNGDLCQLMGRFTEGDVVALYQVGDNQLAGIYHIGKARGSSLALINNQYTVASAYEGEVAVEIMHTARTNQLTASVGTTTTHGYQSIAEVQDGLQSYENQLPSDQLIKQRAFADLLNASLMNGSGLITADQIPDDLSFQLGGECVDCVQKIEASTLVDGTVEVSVSECFEATNYVSNARILPNGKPGCDFQVAEGCYDGWSKVTGTPNVFDTSPQPFNNVMNIWSKGPANKPSSESVRNKLSQPLVPGKQYKFVLDYKRSQTRDANDITRYPIDHTYVELSKSTGSESFGNQPTSAAPSIVTTSAGVSELLWHGQNIENVEWNTLEVDFSVNEASEYLFFSLRSETDVHYQNFIFRNPRIYAVDELNTSAGQQCSFTVNKDERFEVDTHSGQLILVSDQAPCYPTEVNCLQFCESFDNAPYQTLDNVVAASAQTFTDRWDYYGQGYELSGRNAYENGEQGQWRPKAAYSYNQSLQTAEKNFQKGKFLLDRFNWQKPASNSAERWLATTTTEVYSPHGEPLQSRNLIGVPSTAKFGYNQNVPYLTAQNAARQEVFFESFESRYTNSTFEDGYQPGAGQGEVSTTSRHSGQAAWKLGNLTELTLQTLVPEDFSEGMWVKFWIKAPAAPDQLENNVKVIHLETDNLYPVRVVARTGEWQLLQTYVVASEGNFTPKIQYFGSGEVWLDDIRVQPADAQVATYVYDPATLRLLTTFDDQHFGLFYQYNAEGKLIRQQVETERGIRSLQETHYNTPAR